MKIALALIGLLFAVTAPALEDRAHDPRFAVKVAPLQTQGVGSLITVTNNSQIPIVAVLIACDTPESSSGASRYVHYFRDSVLESDDIIEYRGMLEIGYQESASFEVHEPDYDSISCKQETAVKAIMFADGSSFGESEWIGKILHVRQFTLQNVDDLLDLLQRAKSSGLTKAQLQRQIAVLRSHDYDLIHSADGQASHDPGMSAPMIYGNAYLKSGVGYKQSDDEPISEAFLEGIEEPYLDLRQRLIYSEPRLQGIPEVLDSGDAPSPNFTMRIPVGLGSENDEIWSFWSLHVNGRKPKEWHDLFAPPKESFTYGFHTMVAGRAAASLQGAVYVSGCEIKFIDVQNVSELTGSDDLRCKKLPTISFVGQVLPSELLAGRNSNTVQVTLHNNGDNGAQFFDFDIGAVALDENGMFKIDLPDFSADPGLVSGGPGRGAFLRFSAGGYLIAAVNDAADSRGNLHPVLGYGGVVNFRVVPK
jgi:hypothetical protein